ncbi:lipase maturation factor family protein [Streptomyces sp. NPDC016562]|uniref:lipase maturation factor family protein n=1 Tax=Streptomyces sp. NPDC016562 TaxID=3364966 RepID=UPI0036FCC59D
MEWFTDGDYWLSRLVFQRGLAALYFIAFLSTAHQFRALIGEHGLLPVPRFVAAVPFRRSPSIFHFHYSDRFCAIIAWTGVTLSVALAAGAADRIPLWASMLPWALLWVLYLSLVNVGQTWFGFMWESLLLEAGFLAIFLGNEETAPPLLILFLLRWLLFRLEFGAGLIKLRHDPCWRDLTCLYYHHETQPMPGPLTWFFHRLPRPLHRVEVAASHVAQLVAPVMLFAPQPTASVVAGFIVVTQLWLVASGNFAWLNWLTILIAVTAIDGARAADVLGLPRPPAFAGPPAWYEGTVLAVTVLMVVLSYWPIRNLLSRHQVMNYSFNPFHLMNTYGAFGTIERTRHEVVLEGTDEPEITDDTVWQAYGFKGKPGDVRRMPPQVAPYHLRLDWMMWFAAISPAYARPWFTPLLAKLLDNDPVILKLLRHNPFPDSPPTFLRARLYRYRFTDRHELRRTHAWWHRTLVGEYLPPVTKPR